MTTPAASIDRYFREYCEVVETLDQGTELFGRLRSGEHDSSFRDRALAGAAIVREHHTWTHRLQQVINTIGSRPVPRSA